MCLRLAYVYVAEQLITNNTSCAHDYIFVDLQLWLTFFIFFLYIRQSIIVHEHTTEWRALLSAEQALCMTSSYKRLRWCFYMIVQGKINRMQQTIFSLNFENLIARLNSWTLAGLNLFTYLVIYLPVKATQTKHIYIYMHSESTEVGAISQKVFNLITSFIEIYI